MGSYKKIGLSHEMVLIDTPPLLAHGEPKLQWLNITFA